MTTVSEVPSAARRPWRWLSVLLRLALAAGFTAGIVYLMTALAGRFEPKVKPGAAVTTSGPTVPTGTLAEVKLVKRTRAESAVGTIRAIHEVAVASKILARVKDVRIKAGQSVKEGEELVVLDDADLQARLRQVRAAETGAGAKLNQARTDVDRANRLRAVNSVSQQELEQANTAFLSAKAEFERTQHAVNEAQILMGYATLRAPITGIVIDKKVDAGDTVSPGQVLLTMYDRTKMQMVATVRESLAMRLEAGQQLAARIDALGLDCHATISEIVPEAQAESRSFQVKVTGPCPPNVYSGMFGRIFIPLGEEEILVIPTGAARRVGQLDVVTVADGGKTRRHVVQLGRDLPEGREVLSGLKEGEKVIIPLSVSGREGGA